jgi:uncharacterized protein YqeY
MTTKTQLESDLKDAMRTGNDVRKRTVRMVLSAVRMAELEKGQPLDENGILSILQKEVKTRQESIAEAERANRSDLAADTQAEITVLEGYLPKQMTPEELEALVREAIAEAGAASPSDMGKVMKLLTPRLQGQASGSQASAVVRQLLQG